MSGGGDPATVALVPATARAILGGTGWFFKIIRKAIIWVRSCRSWECWKILGEDSSPAGSEGNGGHVAGGLSSADPSPLCGDTRDWWSCLALLYLGSPFIPRSSIFLIMICSFWISLYDSLYGPQEGTQLADILIS